MANKLIAFRSDTNYGQKKENIGNPGSYIRYFPGLDNESV